MTDAVKRTPVFKTVTLDNPVTRPDGDVTTIRLRKPQAGELRGVSLQAIFQADVVAVARLLPRISEPVMLEHEVYDLEAEDFAQIASDLAGFLLTKAQKAEAGLTE